MGCDLCGTENELFNAIVENSLMSVCKRCLKFGKLVERNKNFDVDEIIKKPIRNKVEESIIRLVLDYNLIIKKSREKLNLTQEDVGKKLNEKLSLIQKVENKSIQPNGILIKKFENLFKVKLTEEIKQEKVNINFKSSALTIGDLIRFKNK